MLNWLQLKRGVQLSKSYETKCDNPAITCYFSATEVKKIINFGWAGHSHTSHWEDFGNTGSTKIVKYRTFTGKKVKFGPFWGGKIVKFHKNTKKNSEIREFYGKKK